jgi:hypothetical protein
MPEGMRARPRVLLTLVVALLCGWSDRSAAAQSQDPTAMPEARRLTGGAEVTMVAGPADDEAFFNYTDYEHNQLRVARVRLMGEWRLASRLSMLGEARSENGDGLQIPALYMRWQPWAHRTVNLQVGRIPPVIGSFTRRAYGRDNVVIGSPLMYQYLSSLRPDALPANADDLLRMRGRGWQPSYPLGSQSIGPGIPVISSSRWDTGAEATWQNHLVEIAGAVTLGSPATPVVVDPSDGLMYSGRIAIWLPGATTIGVSAARGAWINRSVLNLVPEHLRHRNSESLAGVDFETGVGPWLVRAEWVYAAFELPFISSPDPGTLTTMSSFVECRYRFQPRWQVAGRVEHIGFSDIVGTLNNGAPTSWDAPVDRVEATLGFRAMRNVDIRGGYQYNWRDGGRVHERGYPTLMASFWF